MDLQRNGPAEYTLFFSLHLLSLREKCSCSSRGRAGTWNQETYCPSWSLSTLSPHLTHSPLHPSLLMSKNCWPGTGKLETLLLRAEGAPTASSLPAGHKHCPAWEDVGPAVIPAELARPRRVHGGSTVITTTLGGSLIGVLHILEHTPRPR